MISSMLQEYKAFCGDKSLVLLRAIICYYRVPKFRVVTLIRAMQNTDKIAVKRRYQKKLKLKYMVDVGLNAKIGKGFWVEHYNGLVIGDAVCIGDDCTLYQNVTIGQKKGLYPHLGNNVTIYPGAIVLGDIKVGDNAIISAGAVVVKDVPKMTMVAGNPASIKKKMVLGE